MGGERPVAQFHGVVGVRMTTSRGAVKAETQKEVDGQWVLFEESPVLFQDD